MSSLAPAGVYSSVGGRVSAPENDVSGIARFFAVLPIFLVIWLAKISVPPLADLGIPIAVPAIICFSFLGVFFGGLRFDLAALIKYIGLVVLLGFGQWLFAAQFSMSAFMFMVLLHFPYTLRSVGNCDWTALMSDLLSRWVFCIGVLAVIQFFGQFVVGAAAVFPIENFVPTAFVVKHFNMQGPLAYGSPYFRANGIFMLEPSYFSQFMAIGITHELASKNRWGRVAFYLFAIILSYSGTGLLMLGVVLPIVLLSRMTLQQILLAVGALIAVAAVIVGLAASSSESNFLTGFLSRIGEFQSQGSSGFARFIGGGYMFDKLLFIHPEKVLFGYGAGSFDWYSPLAPYPAEGMTLYKIVFEYGFVGAAAYFAFLIGAISNSAKKLRFLPLAIGACYFVNGISTPFAHCIALAVLVWTKRESFTPNPGVAQVTSGNM